MASHLYDLVRQRAVSFPDAIAFGGQQGLIWKTIDSRQLLDLVDRLAEELAAKGVKESDRVVVWLPSQWRTPVYLFALWKLGAIVVPFDREMNPEAGTGILDAVEPRFILAGHGERPAWARDENIVEWWEPGSEVPNASAPWSAPGEELAVAAFTSGTTGVPKGCMITHANLRSQIQALADAVPLDPSCRLASVLPLSHLFELTCGMLYAVSTGAAIHYIPSRRGPDIVRVLREQQITHMMCVPQLLMLMGQALEDQLAAALPAPVLRALKAVADRVPLGARRFLFAVVHRKLGGHLRLMVSGGAALPVETHRQWERLGVRVVQGYGASECSPVIACGTWEGKAPVGSVGRPLPGVDTKLSPEGELLVHGPNVMRGYWKDPERTAEVLTDGWYSTGDLARIDAAGNVWIEGRARDLIVLPSGLNLWPQDVEDVLRAHPSVSDATIVAVPTAAGGATLHAYLIPHGSVSDISQIVSASNARLAQHQRVASASWWPDGDFPRTSTLKVRRNLLPQPEAGATVRVSLALAADDPVGQAICGIARTSAVQPQQTLGELGLDSLGLVELAVTLEEKTGKAVAEGTLSSDMTVQQVREAVTNAPDVAEGNDRDETGESREQPMWPYTWGRAFRALALPVDVQYLRGVSQTIVLGKEHLQGVETPVIVAGTHHGFPDMSLVRRALAASPSPGLAHRLVAAAGSEGAGFTDASFKIGGMGLAPWYMVLAFGLYPLNQRRFQGESLRRLVQVAQAGNAILIFPQGTHARPQDERTADPAARFRTGAAHLAQALDAPVIPFGLAGTDIILPPSIEGFKGIVFAGVPWSYKRGPLAIAFGEPLRMEASESAEDFTTRLQTESFRLTRMAEDELART
ncbi:MAG: PlsC protein [Chloroflexi bacterium]|nr:PlsC protein [Chloroflexota bacterium]